MAFMSRIFELIDRLGALPAQSFTSFVDSTDDLWDTDLLLSDDELPAVL